ncbi:hypothetical protein DL96DRAFT_206652 [Flagelloscypha sp. PMI_526]|nr:hypothetical protein DL96DRAFT_206652 [Flagelloscypha sp. PMI_526]
MRFFTTLACTFVASISLVSAAHIHGRNALRMAKGLPPLPPRMTTRTDTARRDVPSGIPAPLFENGDFETRSNSPWVYSGTAISFFNSYYCHSGDSCGLMMFDEEANGVITYPISLAPNTDYTMTFYHNFEETTECECTPKFSADNRVQWSGLTYNQQSKTGYTQQTVTFTTSSDNSHEIAFYLSCTGFMASGKWYIDDVTLGLAAPTSTPDRN